MGIKDIINANSKVWTPRLNNYLDSLNDKDSSDKFERKYDTGLHPSQISGCIRATIYKRLKADYIVNRAPVMTRVDPKLRRVFDNGSGAHERLQAYFRDMNVLLGRWYCKACGSLYPQRQLEEQMPENDMLKFGDKNWHSYLDSDNYVFEKLLVPVPESCPHCKAKIDSQFSYSEVPIRSKEYDLEGYTDGVAYAGKLSLQEVSNILVTEGKNCPQEIKDDLWILEFKSENSMKFRKHATAHAEHIFQASCYALGLDIRKIAIIYEAKDTQELMEDDIVITEEDIRAVLAKISLIRACEKRKIVPEPDDITKCTYCNYKNICITNMDYQEIEHKVKEIEENYLKKKSEPVEDELTLDKLDTLESDWDGIF